MPSNDVIVRLMKAELTLGDLPTEADRESAKGVILLSDADKAAEGTEAPSGKTLFNYDGKSFVVNNDCYVVKIADDFYQIRRGYYPARINGKVYLVPAARWGNIDTSSWTSVSGTTLTYTTSDFRSTDSVTKEFTGLPMMTQTTDDEGRISENYVAYIIAEYDEDLYSAVYAMSAQSEGQGAEAGDMHRSFTVINKSTFEQQTAASVWSAKELIGRNWRNDDANTAETNEQDTFTFEMLPLGKGTYYTAEEAEAYNTEHHLYGSAAVKEGDLKTVTTGEGASAVTVPVYAKDSNNATILDIPMPVDNDESEGRRKTFGQNMDGDVILPAEGTITSSSDAISTTQREDKFDPITYNQTDLEHTGSGMYQGDYFYEIRERIGNDYVALAPLSDSDADKAIMDYISVGGTRYKRVTDDTGYLTYGEWKDNADANKGAYAYWHNPSNGISYTSASHTVRVHVENVNGTLTTSVAYDQGEYSGSAPAFTNYYDVKPNDADDESWKKFIAQEELSRFTIGESIFDENHGGTLIKK